jgi:hypothetical protein
MFKVDTRAGSIPLLDNASYNMNDVYFLSGNFVYLLRRREIRTLDSVIAAVVWLPMRERHYSQKLLFSIGYIVIMMIYTWYMRYKICTIPLGAILPNSVQRISAMPATQDMFAEVRKAA